MKRLLRLCLLAGMVALSIGVNDAVAQAPAAAKLPTAEAQAFLGTWALAFDAEGMAFNLGLTLSDAEGSVAGEVSSDFGASTVTSFRRDAEKLVLGYAPDMNGQSFPIAITMTPTTEGADVEMSFGQGEFVLRGKGTRK